MNTVHFVDYGTEKSEDEEYQEAPVNASNSAIERKRQNVNK